MKKGAGIKCLGRKELAMLYPGHAPMGLNFFSKNELNEIAGRFDFKLIPAERAAMESRLLYCYEVDDSCPCDDDICKL